MIKLIHFNRCKHCGHYPYNVLEKECFDFTIEQQYNCSMCRYEWRITKEGKLLKQEIYKGNYIKNDKIIRLVIDYEFNKTDFFGLAPKTNGLGFSYEKLYSRGGVLKIKNRDEAKKIIQKYCILN